MPRLRGVRDAPGGWGDLLPRVRVPARSRSRCRIAATIQLAGRVTASPQGLEESPDTEGQDAGEIPGGESRRKVAQKGNRQRRKTLRRRRGKGEKVRSEERRVG